MVDNRILSNESLQLVSTISADSPGWGIIPATVVYSVCSSWVGLEWSWKAACRVDGSGPSYSSGKRAVNSFKRNICKLPSQGFFSESRIYHHLFFLPFIFHLGSGSFTHKNPQTFNKITVKAEAQSRAKRVCEYYIYSHFHGANEHYWSLMGRPLDSSGISCRVFYLFKINCFLIIHCVSNTDVNQAVMFLNIPAQGIFLDLSSTLSLTSVQILHSREKNASMHIKTGQKGNNGSELERNDSWQRLRCPQWPRLFNSGFSNCSLSESTFACCCWTSSIFSSSLSEQQYATFHIFIPSQRVRIQVVNNVLLNILK